MLSFRTPHDRRNGEEHIRHIVTGKKLQTQIDTKSEITINPKTKKLNVKVAGKTYILKEDV